MDSDHEIALTKDQLALFGNTEQSPGVVAVESWEVGEEEIVPKAEEIPNPWDTPPEPARPRRTHLISPTLWGGVACLGIEEVEPREVFKAEQLILRNRIFRAKITGTKPHQWLSAPTAGITTQNKVASKILETGQAQEALPPPSQPETASIGKEEQRPAGRQIPQLWNQLRQQRQWLITLLVLASGVIVLKYLLLPIGY